MIETTTPHRSRPLLLLLLAFLPACVQTQPTAAPPKTTYNITSVGNIQSAFHNVTIVALHPEARIARPLASRPVESLKTAADLAITTRLRQGGYTITNPPTAQRLIAYAIGVSEELHDRELLTTFGISPGIDNGDDLRGAIVIAVVHPATNETLWKGSLATPLPDRSLTPAQRDKLINTTVNRILAQLPRRPQ